MRENTKKNIYGRHSEILKAMEMFYEDNFIFRSECFLQIILFSNDNCTALCVKEEIYLVPVSSSAFLSSSWINLETNDS